LSQHGIKLDLVKEPSNGCRSKVGIQLTRGKGFHLAAAYAGRLW
jgi:hypothetical protein